MGLVTFTALNGAKVRMSRGDADELLRAIDRRLVSMTSSADPAGYRELERVRVELSIALARELEAR